MFRQFFHSLEQLPDGQRLSLETVIEHLAYDASGLIPVITQDAKSKDVLMFAWMNRQSLELTLSTKRMTYWSRSRQQLWKKGETSGHVQQLVSMAFDCDGDAIVCLVEQSGAACHTGRNDCFYLKVDLENNTVVIEGEACLP